MELDDPESRRLCVKQLQQADNMTDALAALTALANCDCVDRKPVLEQFYAKWRDEPLVVDKWFGVEAGSRLPGTVARVRELTSHPAFTLKIPTRCTRSWVALAGIRSISMPRMALDTAS